jgi:hypothetical protein
MGYTHYTRRPEELDAVAFRAFSVDVESIFKVATEAGYHLAGGMGEGDPEVGPDRIWFNGAANCGHPARHHGIAWPSASASGVEDEQDAQAGTWIGGARLAARQCSGDCSYETFGLERVTQRRPWDDDARVFEFCKTNYQPYDVVVTAVLIALKRHFGDEVTVSTDGTDKDWEDGRQLTTVACGYGATFHINPDGDLCGTTAAAEARTQK